MQLAWDRRADLFGLTFELHRGATPNFTPGEETRLTELTRSDYLDTSTPPGTAYYALVCVAADRCSPPIRAQAAEGRPLLQTVGHPVP